MKLLSVGQPQDAVAVKVLFVNKVKPAVGVGENCGKVGEIVAVGGEDRAVSGEIVAVSAEGNVRWRRIPDMPLY